MSQWKFILIDRNGVRTEIPEPVNWDDPEIVVHRETEHGWHGVFFDYGFDKLTFNDLGATLIMAEYNQYGVNGNMHLDILFQCSEDNLFDDFYKGGRLAFDQYSDTCGDECSVSVGIEDSEDIMLLRNNYDQAVDLNKNIAFDQVTELTDYDFLNYDQEIPSRGLPQSTGGKSPGGEHSIYPISIQLTTPITGTAIRVRPELTLDPVSEIPVSDPQGENSYAVFPQTDPNLYPTGLSAIVTPAERTACSNGVFNYKIRLKGHLREVADVSRDIRILIDVINTPWSDIGDPTLHEVELLPNTHYEAGDGPDIPFDVSFEGSTFIEIDNPFIAFINFVTFYGVTGSSQDLYVDWDEETEVKVQTVSNCSATDSKAYMINEAISRVSEAITNDKIRFYSESFGRTDSQPYAINYNPCQGLFTITNGLNIRRKLLIDGKRPGYFLSMKDIFDGLNPIWNIGLTIEPDLNRTGFKRLRFEPWRFFYQEDVAAWFNYATKVTREVDPSRLFKQLQVGYNKWQAEGTTGLYELMTKRQYRVSINADSSVLEQFTEFICSPYTIEITRRKSEDTADWQYDNDTFGFCLKKDGSNYSVETFLDNATDITNVIDPNTCYNARITPARNAMRWFDWVMQGLRNIYADSKLIFSKGEGNYIASFQTTSCNIEGKVLAENEDIDLTDFEDLQDARPITYAELVTFEHPMNYNTFKRIKDDPTIRYKSFGYICNGVEYEGWLDELRYRPMKGQATITLIPKNKTKIIAPPEPECLAEVANLVFTPNGDGYMLITWDATVSGATFWQFIVTKDGQPFQTLNVTDTSFQYANLLTGNYSVTVIPFCDTDFPGANYVEGSFDIAAPTFALTLSAILTTGRQPHNKLQLTGTGSFAAMSGFSFGFGQCVDNTSIPGPATCSSYPGSTFPTPQGLFSFNPGDTTKMVESGADTPGADFGFITKVVLFNLVGITPAQITKAVGQTWDLEFI
jgi:hypothetical protein